MAKSEKTYRYIKKYFDGVYSYNEAQKILNLIEEDCDNEDLEKCMNELWEESALYSSNSDHENLQYQLQAYKLLDELKGKNRNKTKPGKIRKFIYISASIAASILLLFISVNYYNQWTEENMTYVSVNSSHGERKTIDLPDGTIVYLNSCSQLSYPTEFKGDSRLVKLDGQAYFKVSKNERQPFVINTHQFNVKVLGTEFDVKAYKEDEVYFVNVETGKVQVDMPEAMIKLTDKEFIELNTLTENYNKYRDESDVAVWRKGNLRFNKTPIKDVVKELERSYNYKIGFAPGQDFDNLITGEHDNKDLVTVLNSIEFTSGIKYKINEEVKQVILYK